MNELWQPKMEYEEYSARKKTISMTFSGRKNTFFCYKRKYKQLNEEQLLALLKEAKENNWTTLDLSDCGIKDLPDQLWDITSLKVLYLGNWSGEQDNYNAFSVISEKIGMLENLEAISIRNLQNLKIPKAFKNMPRLTYLDCFGCGFQKIPNNLLNKNIKGIGIACDMVEQVSKICTIKRIEEIYLTGSTVKALPDEIGTLTSLKTLYLYNSQVEVIPQSLLNLKNIKRFDIQNTPLEKNLPDEMKSQTANELIAYIYKQQNQQTAYFFNESKMIIVGQGNVGKSCLVERIINDKYENKDSTLGIAVKKWTYNNKGKRYTLNIWDFGGQEIYHSTHQFFLTKRSLYIFVWDARAEEEYGRIDYWLKTIESFAADSPIIICINKCDEKTTRINRIDFKEYQKKYPQIQDVLEISCKDNINIRRLKCLVRKIASNLQITREQWLKPWYDIRKEIEQLRVAKPYITYDEYKAICQKYNVDTEEGKSLSKYLHDLGVVLHYQEDPFLKSIVILSPRWATAAVYKILDAQETTLRNRNGVLQLKDLPLIWTDSNMYPEDKHILLLRIMEKFQLCFQLDRESFLVTELLENTSIDCPKGWIFTKDSCIGIVYRYDFMPAGVMTRFIVKIHDYIANIKGKDLCWKKGVYLKNKNAYARVVMKDTISEKKIEVQVSRQGNFEQERELLCAIRSSLQEINSNFEKIQVEEYVPCNCSPNCEFQFPYARLCEAIDKNVETIQCHQSFEQVNILKMLEGIEIMRKEEGSPYTIVIENNPQIKPQIRPQIHTEIHVDSSFSQTSVINIQEVKSKVMEMQGDMAEIKDEVIGNLKREHCEEIIEQLEKIEQQLESVKNMKTPEEVVKSGKLNKLKRWLIDFSNEKSDIRKTLSGAKEVVGIGLGLVVKFKNLAERLGITFLQ